MPSTMLLLDQGLELLLYGMGTVFVFLTVLVFATQALSFIVQRVSPGESVDRNEPEQDLALMQRRRAAAVAAVHRHRQAKS